MSISVHSGPAQPSHGKIITARRPTIHGLTPSAARANIHSGAIRIIQVSTGNSTYDAEHPLGQIAAAHPHVDLHAWQNACGIKLNMIQVAPDDQGKGYASAALRDLIAYADSICVPIALTPGIPEGRKGLSQTALKHWYTGCGFVPNRGRHKDFNWAEAMIRPARST